MAVQIVRVVTVTASYVPHPDKRWPEKAPPHLPILSANDRSRWCTVWSLVERGTYRIDEIIQQRGWNTIDKVKVPEKITGESHYYSSKPPVLATFVAGLYWVFKHGIGWDLLTQTHSVVQTTLLLINVLPLGISLWLWRWYLQAHVRCPVTQLLVFAAAAFATFLGTFCNTLNNHTISAQAIWWAICCVVAAQQEDRLNSGWRLFLAGIWAGFGAVNEFPAIAFVALLGVALLVRDARKTWACYLPGVALPLAIHFGLTYLVTGSLLPFYAGYGTELYNFTENGRPSYWMNPQGIDKGGDSPLVYLFHCLLGHHGIFSLTPIFLLCLGSWWELLRRRERPLKNWSKQRIWAELGLGLTVIVVGFYLTRTKNYNYGGVSCSLRWAIWLTPLWLLSLIPVCESAANHVWFRRLATCLLAVSVFSAMFPWGNPWTHPWLFQVLEQAGWVRY